MTSQTLQAKLYELGITRSRSRPRVSNDKPYSESFFRALKYYPQWPSRGFESLNTAWEWVRDFVNGYNNEHRHSRIRFVTPSQRHRGEGGEILAHRVQLYEQAKAKNPSRWSGDTRNWNQVGSVMLNLERDLGNERIAA